MCLAIPARIISIEQDFAQVDMGGNRLKISTLLMDQLCVGDYVIVHAGFAIHKVDEQEAQESLRLLREISIAMP
ncbi:MAG: HypC/HybG/HupF family hydrogenase formation chaperone [Deltaproteobacteria bacterium]|nr:HypC/HybG/HupF family hydrogenase formation chaperone [Deltaproteobacteria bacterium]